MTINHFEIALDIAKRESWKKQEITIGQGDHDGTVLDVTVLDHGKALDVETLGHDVYFEMLLPDGVTAYREKCTVDGSVASVVIDELFAASEVGKTDVAYISIEDSKSGAVIASTERIRVNVLRRASAIDPPNMVRRGSTPTVTLRMTNSDGSACDLTEEDVTVRLAEVGGITFDRGDGTLAKYTEGVATVIEMTLTAAETLSLTEGATVEVQALCVGAGITQVSSIAAFKVGRLLEGAQS